MTDKERHIMEHSLGWPKRYRNHFVTDRDSDDGKIIAGLCARGMMRESGRPSEMTGGVPCFAVTDAGVAALEELAPVLLDGAEALKAERDRLREALRNLEAAARAAWPCIEIHWKAEAQNLIEAAFAAQKLLGTP